jgi:hypothetical protein
MTIFTRYILHKGAKTICLNVQFGALLFLAIWCNGAWAQRNEIKTYPVYGTAGVNQLITTNFSTPKSPTASGIQVALGTGPWARFFLEAQISAHRLLGAGKQVKSTYLMGYSWRAGVLPFKRIPFVFYGGAGYHDYHISYEPLVIQNVQLFSGVQYRRFTDFWSVGMSYPVHRSFDVDVSFRREPYFNNPRPINAHYLAISCNAWLFKYDKFKARK